MTTARNTDTPILPESTIRYTMDNLGLIGAPGTVSTGDLGRFLGPASEPEWFLTEPASHPGKLCPVYRSMIEPA